MLKVNKFSGNFRKIKVEPLEFEIQEGDFFLLFGPDDSGKTELLLSFMGLAPRKKETFFYCGTDAAKLPVSRWKEIRYVPDGILFENKMTVSEYFDLWVKHYRKPVKGKAEKEKREAEEKSRRQELVEYFQLDEKRLLTQMTYEGNKLAVIIAALLTNPGFLILDEPLNFMTRATYEKLLKWLKKENENGMTILLCLEKYEHSCQCGNRFVYVKKGVPVAAGTTEKIKSSVKSMKIRKGKFEVLKEVLGEPVSEDEDGKRYICESYQDKLEEILKKAEVSIDDVLIEKVSAEEMLEREAGLCGL